MKKILFSILIISILMSLSSKVVIDATNDIIDDINTNLGGTIKVQKMSNNKALDSNVRALNAFLSNLKSIRINSIDNAINFDLDAIQALFIRNFNITSVLLLILLLSSLTVLPKIIKG